MTRRFWIKTCSTFSSVAITTRNCVINVQQDLLSIYHHIEYIVQLSILSVDWIKCNNFFFVVVFLTPFQKHLELEFQPRKQLKSQRGTFLIADVMLVLILSAFITSSTTASMHSFTVSETCEWPFLLCQNPGYMKGSCYRSVGQWITAPDYNRLKLCILGSLYF